MKRALECAWQERGALSLLLLPVSWLFAALVAGRRKLYALGWLRSTRLPVPVIVIGNISVGGSGKTPLTIELASRFRQLGRRVGIVSRGYGGQVQTGPHQVATDDPAELCGDEPLLMARRSACPVIVCRDRVAAARRLLALGCDLILADDGLQHYALARDIEIIVIDGKRRFGNGRLLPAGPLREPQSRLQETGFVWINGVHDEAEAGYLLHTEEAVSLVDGARRDLAEFAGQGVHAVAGIGAPARFFAALRLAGLELHEHPFPDHHVFTAADLDFADERPVLMTEKDAVKCEHFAQPGWYAVPARVELPEPLWRRLNDRLQQVSHG